MIKSNCTFVGTALFLGLLILPVNIDAKQIMSHGNGHIHEDHPTWWHGEGEDKFKRIYLSEVPEAGEPDVRLTNSETDILFGLWTINNSCAPVTYNITQTKSRTHSVSIGASETIGGTVDLAAFALFAKLKATAHASVTFNQNWTDTSEDIIQISAERTVFPCQMLYFYAWKSKYEAEGSVDVGSHKIICECMMHARQVTSFCERITLTGNGVGWDNYGTEWVQQGLKHPCPCTTIAEGSDIVMEPVGPGSIPPIPGSGNDSGH